MMSNPYHHKNYLYHKQRTSSLYFSSFQLIVVVIIFIIISLLELLVLGEIISTDIVLHPDYPKIAFGSIRRHGIIDLSQLSFDIIDSNTGSVDTDDNNEQEDKCNDDNADIYYEKESNNLFCQLFKWVIGIDDVLFDDVDSTSDDAFDEEETSSNVGNQKETVSTSNGNRCRNRQLLQRFQSSYVLSSKSLFSSSSSSSFTLLQHRRQEKSTRIDQKRNGTFLDILIFPLSKSCMISPTNLVSCISDNGIGKSIKSSEMNNLLPDPEDDDTNEVLLNFWCCTELAISIGLCRSEQYGQTLIDNELYKGDQRSILISTNASSIENSISKPLIYVNETKTYAVLFTNCRIDDERKRTVRVTGNIIWKSKHGYLPSELYPFYQFYTILLKIYIIVLLWFCYHLKHNVQTRNDIEIYILITLLLGFIGIFCGVFDLYAWNQYGYDMIFVQELIFVFDTLKSGYLQCISVMVGMGYGLRCNKLRDKYRRVVFTFSFCYISNIIIFHFISLYMDEQSKILSNNQQENKMMYMKHIISFSDWIDTIINRIFIIFIIISLSSTVEYFETTKEVPKLQRMIYLRNIFISSMLFVTLYQAFFYMYDCLHSLEEVNNVRYLMEDGLIEINDMCVLFGIAILWKPNAFVYTNVHHMQRNNENYGNNHDDNTNSRSTPNDDENENGTEMVPLVSSPPSDSARITVKRPGL